MSVRLFPDRDRRLPRMGILTVPQHASIRSTSAALYQSAAFLILDGHRQSRTWQALTAQSRRMSQALYGLWRKLSEVECMEELPLLRAHMVSAGADISLRMLMPRLHVFLPKAGCYEETRAANMALLPGKQTAPWLLTRASDYMLPSNPSDLQDVPAGHDLPQIDRSSRQRLCCPSAGR